MSSTAEVQAPALIHFQDCDDLALGRFVRDLTGKIALTNGALDEHDIGILAVAAVIDGGARIDRHRGVCDCARLRIAHLDGLTASLTKARTVARNTGDEITYARHTQSIARLRDQKAAIRDTEITRARRATGETS